MANSNGGRINFQVGYNVDQNSVNQVRKSLQDLQKIKIADFKGTDEQLQQVKKTASQVEKALINAFNPSLNSINIQEFNSILSKTDRTVNTIYSDFSKAGAVGREAFTQMTSSIVTTNAKLTETKTIISAMGETMANTVRWGITSSIMNSFTNSVQQAFSYVKSLDSALTDIRIVTGDSTEEMGKFADQANRAAQELGRSTMDYTKAALTFYQQGLSDQDVQARTEATLKAQNITGAGEQMADYLTAVWNGYKVANEEAELYVDKLAAVADSSASNMSQLAVAMSKVASVANSLGVPVDSLNAQIATIVATTRNAPQSVGNALKTIYSRINDISTGAQDAQISLGNYSKKMLEVGVSVLDANGHLRDTGDVIEQIGGKWQSLSREQQIYLARTMAGQRQYNNLIALFDNWNRYTDLVNVSLDSQGSLMEKNSRYLDSLAAHMEQMGAAGQRVKAALIDENDIKGLVDFGTNIINLFGNFIESIGGGTNALIGLGGVLTSLFSDTIAKEIGNSIIKTQELKASLQSMSQAATNTQAMKKQAAYLDEANVAYRQYIDNLSQVHRTWSVLSVDEIKAQQQRAADIESYSQQREEIKRNQQAAKEFMEILSGQSQDIDKGFTSKAEFKLRQFNKQLQEGKIALQQFFNDPDVGGSSSLLQNFELLNGYLNQVPDAQIVDVLNKIKEGSQLTQEQLEEVYTKLQQFYTEVSRNVDTSQNIDKVKAKYQQLGIELQKTQNQFDKTNQKANTIFDVRQITNFVAGLGKVAAGLNGIVNLTKVWKNENNTLGQKLLQTFTSLSFTVPMLYSGLKQVVAIVGVQLVSERAITQAAERRRLEQEKITKEKAAQVLLDKIKGGDRSHQTYQAYQQAQQAANKAGEALNNFNSSSKNVFQMVGENAKKVGEGVSSAFGKIGTALGTTAFKVGGLAVTFGTLTAVAAGVVAAGAALYMWYTKDARAAQKAAETAKQAEQHYKELKNTLNQFNSSISAYDNAIKALNELSKGTDQWNQKLKETNEQVLQLLKNYPQLAGAISQNVDGLLTIDKQSQAYKNYLDSLNRSVQAANVAQINTQQKSNEANRTSTITNLSRQGSFAGINRQQLDRVITAVENRGQGILGNTKALQQVANLSSKEVKVIQDNSDKILTAVATIENNTKAIEIMSTTVAQDLLKGNTQYQTSKYQNEFANIVGQELSNVQFNSAAYRTQVNGIYADDTKAIADRYAEILGQEVKKNVFGSGYSVKNAQTGQWDKVSADFVKDEIAAADALDNLDDIIKQTNDTIIKTSAAFGDLTSAALKFKNVKTAEDLENISFVDISLNDLLGLDANKLREIFEIGDDVDLQGFLEKQAQIIQKNTTKYIHDLPKGVQQAFNTLDKKSMSDQMQRQVGGILSKVFTSGEGVSGLENSVADALNQALGKGKLEQLLSQNFDQMNLNDVTNLFRDLGLTVPQSTEALQAFLNAMKSSVDQLSAEQIYNNVHDIIDKKNGKTLEYNDQISAEDYQKLVDAGVAVEGAFQKLTSGAYKFIGVAEEFYNAANQISLQPFLDEINRLREQVAKGQSVNYDSLSKIAYGQRTDGTYGIQYDQAQNQIDALKTLGAISDQQYADWNNLIEKQQITRTQLEQILSLINANQKALENYQNTAQEKLHDQQMMVAYSQQDIGQLRNMRNREDTPFDTLSAQQYAGAVLAASEAEGIEIDNVKTLVNLFEKQADSLDWINDNLDSNQEAMYDVAAAIQDTISGIESIQKSWKQTIKEGVLHPDPEVINETAQALSDMFNQDVDASFVQQHLEDIRALAQGDIDAVTRLGLELANLQINKIAVEAELDTSNFDWSVQSLQEQLANTDWGQIQIGTSIDDQDFYDALQNFIIASGATEQQINEILAGIGYQPEIEYKQIQLDDDKNSTSSGRYYYETEDLQGNIKRVYVDEELGNSLHSAGITTIPIIKGSKFAGGSRNLRNIGGSRVTPKAPSSSGGKKGGGGKGSTPKTTTIETKAAPQRTAKKQADYDPYEQVTKRYQRQQDIIDELQQKQKKLVNKDRLKNIEQQNKALEDQAKILQDRLAISQNAAEKNTTAWFAKELQTAFGKNVGFDADGRIANRNQTEQAAVDAYNKAVEKADKEYEKALAKYNANAGKALTDAQKKQIQNELKAAEDKKKKAIDIAKQQYDRKTDLLDSYEKAWQEDEKTREEIEKLWQQIYENRIIQSKIKVDLDIDSGDLERQWLEFENKVIKKIKKNDFVEQAKANAKQIASYFNSGQIESTKQQIDFIRKQIEIMESGGTSDTYGTDMAQAQKDLEQYMKQQMDDLEKIQDLVEEMQDNYLDAIDKARDKMDEQIDQYERVNKLIDHNVKLTQLLYGDKAYDTMDKYYEKQKQNNQEALQSLRAQQQYWQQRMDNETPGSEAWQKFKKNVDDATDNLNDKLEQMIQNLSNQWQNRVDGIIDKLNNALTGGRGLDYLDEQWDYINNYDDKFLDTVESKMGIQDVQSLYNSAIESVAGNPKAQQRINKLMNDQLKILKQKDKLTQYDLDRAKAMLQVEQARMDLEDARNNKTKMRLRRDSQGNYTYQYVADEGKLEDLQSALADAQNNLYNMDKEHYKQNLNDMYDTYKDYLDNMRSLTAEYQATQDEEERRRIKARMELLQESYSKLSEGLTQDNEYALRYLTESYFDAMGQNPADFSQEEQFNILKENVPQVASDIQTLTDNIVGAGGLLPATADAIKEITDAIEVYDEEVTGILETAGTSLDVISQVVDAEGDYLDNNITKAKELVTANEQLISSIDDEIAKVQELLNYVQQYLQGIMDIEEVLANLRDGYDEQQRLLDHEVTVAQEIAPTANELDTTLGRNVSTPEGRTASDVAAQLDYISMLNSNTQEQIKEGVIEGITETGQLIDSVNIGEVQSVTPYDEYEIGQHIQQLKDTYESQINSLYNQIADLESRLTSYPGMVTNIQQLDQDVRITANFPNVNSSAEIEQAFYDLVNAAAQYSSRYKQSNSANS